MLLTSMNGREVVLATAMTIDDFAGWLLRCSQGKFYSNSNPLKLILENVTFGRIRRNPESDRTKAAH